MNNTIKTRKTRRIFTDEFKMQMVNGNKAGKRRIDGTKEYDGTPSALDKWLKKQ